jgi:hypothetical protein
MGCRQNTGQTLIHGLGAGDRVTGEVRYRDLQFRYSSRQAERLAHKRWKKKGWSDAKIAEFELLFQIKRVQ